MAEIEFRARRLIDVTAEHLERALCEQHDPESRHGNASAYSFCDDEIRRMCNVLRLIDEGGRADIIERDLEAALGRVRQRHAVDDLVQRRLGKHAAADTQQVVA